MKEIRLKYRSTKQIDVIIGDLELYFSYETLVAFQSPETGLVVSENVWSTTTGRHLNEIHPNKDIRIPYEEFHKKQIEVLKSREFSLNQ